MRQARWLMVDLLIPAFSVMLVAGALVLVFDHGAWWAITEEAPASPHYFLTLSGDGAVGAALAPRLVAGWLARRGAVQISRPIRTNARKGQELIDARLDGAPVEVMIRTGGNDAGFADLAVSSTDVALATRSIRPYEARRGDLAGHVTEHLVGHGHVQSLMFDTAVTPANAEVGSFLEFILSGSARALFADAGYTSAGRSAKHSG